MTSLKNLPTYILFFNLFVYYLTSILLLNGIQNHANAETLLTKGMESKSKELPVVAKWTNLTDYQRDDQCFVKPETEAVFSFAFVFQMAQDSINSGTGLTICYAGQLDKQNTGSGMVPQLPFRAPNIKRGNSVAEACEKARMELKAKCWMEKTKEGKQLCEEFTSTQWHGINLISDGPDELKITVSTSNKNFVVARKHFKDDQLVLKLTRHNDILATFSRIIGPGFHPYASSEYDHLLELTNIVKTKENTDEKLRNAFFAKVGAGAQLRKYAGIWSLGMEILPSIEGEMALSFYTIRSNCSEMDVTFLMPWESHVKHLPKTEPKEAWSLPYSNLTKLIMNNTIKFRGRVHENAKKFIFSLENVEVVSEIGFYGIRLKATFEDGNGKIVFEKKTSFTGDWREIQDHPWLLEGKHDPIAFKAGHHFILEVNSQMDDFQMRYNCGPWHTYSRGGAIDYVNWMNITIDGHVDIYNISGGPGGPPGHHEAFPYPLTSGEGFFQRANFSIWTDYNITLHSSDEKNWQSEVLKMAASKRDERINFYWNNLLRKDKEFMMNKNEGKYIQNGSDLHIMVKEEMFQITLDDHEIFKIGRNNETVQFVKVDIDGAVDIIRQNRTFLAPTVFKLNGTDRLQHLPAYIIKGKVPNDALHFTLDLLLIRNLEMVANINDYLSPTSNTTSLMHIYVDFKNDRINNNIKDFDPFTGGFVSRWAGNEFFPMIFTKGDFEIRIETADESHKRYKLIVGSEDVSYEMKLRDGILPNAVQILDGIFLYEKPKFVKKIDGI